MSVEYSPGGWVVLAGPRRWLFAQVEPTAPLVTRCWPLVERGAPLDEVLGVIAHEGLRAVGGFAAVSQDDEAVRVIVRGCASVDVTPSGGDVVRVRADGVATWLDRTVDTAAARLVIRGDEPPDVVRLPLTVGAALASTMWIGAETAAPTTERATGTTAAPPPAPGAVSQAVSGVTVAPTVATVLPPAPGAVVPSVSGAVPPLVTGGVVAPASGGVADPVRAAVSAAGAPEAVEPVGSRPPHGEAANTAHRLYELVRPNSGLPAEPPPQVPAGAHPAVGHLFTGHPAAGHPLADHPPAPSRPPAPAAPPARAVPSEPQAPEPPVPPGLVPPHGGVWPPAGAGIGHTPPYGAGVGPVLPGAGEVIGELSWLPPPPPAPGRPVSWGAGGDPEVQEHTRIRPGTGVGAQTVSAVPCGQGHPNPPGTPSCRQCGAAVPVAQPRDVPRPVLGVLRPLAGGEPIVLDRDVVLGRNPTASFAPGGPNVIRVQSPNQEVSGTHLAVTLDGWTVTVRDLGSSNGTTVTDAGTVLDLVPREPVTIAPGAVVTLGGEVALRYEVLDEAVRS